MSKPRFCNVSPRLDALSKMQTVTGLTGQALLDKFNSENPPDLGNTEPLYHYYDGGQINPKFSLTK